MCSQCLLSRPRLPAERRVSGRPLDPELSVRFVDAACELLANEGARALNADRLAATLRAGKAAVYRRWSDVSLLAADVVRGQALVVAPADHGSLEADLHALARSWTEPLTVHERAAAALLGDTARCPALRAAFDTSLTGAVEAVVRLLIARAGSRGEPREAGEPQGWVLVLIRSVVLLRLSEGPLSRPDAACIAEQALLPHLRSRRASARSAPS